MKKLELLTKYNFHDSLLENITYDKEKKKVILEIDFCNWKQKWYDESDEETSTILLSFENVYGVLVPEFELNSDEIIEFELLSKKEVKIVIFNDISETSYKIVIKADTFEITNK